MNYINVIPVEGLFIDLDIYSCLSIIIGYTAYRNITVSTRKVCFLSFINT